MVSRLIKPILLMATLLTLIACDRASEQAETKPLPRLVRTLTVTSTAEGLWRELPGVVDAAQKADLSFRIAGKLNELLANEGDMVESGQAIAKLDDRDIRIQMKSRQADYDQAHADYVRGQKLVKKGLISRSDFEKLEAQDAAARSALEMAKQNLAYTILKAPFAGEIARRYVDNYEEVTAKQTIYTLQDLSSMTIKADVPESVMILADDGNDLKLAAMFDMIPNRRFPITLKEVSTQANPDSNTFRVTFNLPRIENYNVLPGMSVTVRGERVADSPQLRGTVLVPAQAVLEDTAGRFVYIAKPLDDNLATIDKRSVTTGRLSSAGLEVLSGLEIGDRIVAAGMSKMRQGLQVRLAPE